MDFNTYIPLARRTAKLFPTAREDMRHAALGLITEVGEFTSEVKRIAIYEKLMTVEMRAHMLEELGDTYWYIPLGMLALSVDTLPNIDDVNDSELADKDLAGLAMTLNLLSATVSAGVIQPDAIDRYDQLKSLAAMVVVLDKCCEYLGTTGDAVRAANIEKLRLRYPDKYSNAAAEARADKGGLPHTAS